MKDWFQSLEPRERAIVGIGGILAIVIVGWGFVWKPLVDGTAVLGASVAEKRELLTDLRRAEQLAPSAGARPGAGSESLILLVDTTAQSVGLPPFPRTAPDGPDGIRVSFQEVPFDRILSWLILLEQSYGIAVDSASFNGTRERGLVTGQIALSRS